MPRRKWHWLEGLEYLCTKRLYELQERGVQCQWCYPFRLKISVRIKIGIQNKILCWMKISSLIPRNLKNWLKCCWLSKSVTRMNTMLLSWNTYIFIKLYAINEVHKQYLWSASNEMVSTTTVSPTSKQLKSWVRSTFIDFISINASMQQVSGTYAHQVIKIKITD